MSPAHYVLVPNANRQTYMIFESPITVKVPWGNGPEMFRRDFEHAIGPHRRGLFFSHGFQQGVGMLLDGQSVQ